MLGLCTTINIAQNIFWRRKWVWNSQYWQTFYCLWSFTTIMENKSKFISKIFYSYKSSEHLCKHLYLNEDLCFPFLNLCIRGSCHSSLYDKPDNIIYSLKLILSLHKTNETTPIYIFLSHMQSKFCLMIIVFWFLAKRLIIVFWILSLKRVESDPLKEQNLIIWALRFQ